MTPEQYANYLLKIYGKDDAIRVTQTIINKSNIFQLRSIAYYSEVLEILKKV